MTILITGSTGFIGSALTQHLHQQNRKLTVATRKFNEYSFPSDIRKVFVGDLLPKINWKDALKEVDTVIHLAAHAHIIKKHQTRDLITTFQVTNTHSTTNLAQQAADAGIKRFIFISSIGVNGTQTFEAPFAADDKIQTTSPSQIITPGREHTPYAQSKYEAEISLRRIAKETNMQVVIIRPPLVYGADAPGTFKQLMKILSYNIPLPLGAINNRRSFVSLSNLIDLITKCIDHPAAANHTFLVSDNEDISTTELLNRLNRSLGKKSILLPVPHKLLEVSLNLLGKQSISQSLLGNLEIDIKKTQKVLNWSPPVSIDKALQETANAWLNKVSSRY